MATFPNTIPLSYDTRLPLQAGKRVTIFEDNSNIVQNLSTNEIVVGGQLICPWLTEAERDTVMSFYQTNKDLTFDFVNPHDDLIYDLRFVDPAPTPFIDKRYSPARYQIVLNVIGEKQ